MSDRHEFLATTCPPSGARMGVVYLGVCKLTGHTDRWWVGRFVFLACNCPADFLDHAEHASEAAALAEYAALLPETMPAVDYREYSIR